MRPREIRADPRKPAWLAGRALSRFPFGVAPADAGALGAVVGLLGTGGLIAAHAPARRAASVSPAEVLRSE